MTDITAGRFASDLFSADEWSETDGNVRQFLATAARYVFSGIAAPSAPAARNATSGRRNPGK
ncbi:MAG: hypothetical protein KDJ88_06620 [Bauldia sp.]|nr:hypothetical protein [Bauldia sp.]